MNMNDNYSSQCEKKWNELKIIIPELMKVQECQDCRGRALERLIAFKWVLVKKTIDEAELELTVLIEYDYKFSETGIYYGCRVDNVDEEKIKIFNDADIININKIKEDYYHQYWVQREHLPIEEMENIFLPGDIKNLDYWVFWIRLEEKEPAQEALFGVITIIKSLKGQGWSIK